ncbi:carboxylating nicotinate-nucleotide diphosphorylase [Campylobacter hyointestinalis]|uniref:Probable nicotinate-nucleotide pyrophosphorylase [carboxylating] n=1 Tax=Campylobacter hyointestinalis subsp. hyointestinalis TaxID=91352 RepID=A0A855N8H5_CAMHY|nr:carboxylating nicotinate-nucleotide diphosphorylase [Campylobacter hyointestinalis]PPB56484.1 nicotinate-nucleotide diphosphorylase (carboxylating) [Campylobacter hyointestinalis subsp. hyointestinalis]PPB59174.1 nicotinate-nucleotide diphosphorylase (carboxylating) [Campylobacter hyointestinalis subsp. hyointestinalis]PPB61563.1 nicotinate-nucleotide diphosphorylase (carboxylating) [Campylobacter hyointestinalis subsp. hyointestinalis]PPB70521.1 nicotinate-nucleotide diphosphorylase (carbox
MNENINELIRLALKEDLNDQGDITSLAIFGSQEDEFILISKDNGVLCGMDIFTKVFKFIDSKIKVETYFYDGDDIAYGNAIAKISGRVTSILQAERIAINFISYLCAIATKTSLFVKEANGAVKILDTRKTLPGYRMLAKYAVKCGGGENHRIGLFDMVLIKDNHIDAAGGVTNAVTKVRQKYGNKFKIEVETRNLDEVREALSLDIDIIMLDNMSLDMMSEAVKIISKKVFVEASGNMSFQRIKEVANCGIDAISFGELTHCVKAFDFSLKKEFI